MKPPTPASEHAVKNQPDLRALYYALRERCWVIAVALIISVGLTAFYLARTPRTYAAHAVLQVEQEEQKVLNVQRIQQEDLQGLEWLRTIEQTLQSRSLLGQVLDTLALAADPRFVGPQSRSSREQLITKLARTLEVKLRKGTRLIDITVEHTNPGLAQAIANAVMDEYLRASVNYAASTSQNANAFLLNEARKLETRLERSENALQDYKETLQSVSLEDRQNIVVQQLRDLSAKVTEAKSQLLVQESLAAQVQKAATNTAELLFIPAIANDPAVADLRREFAKQESEIASLKQRCKEKHPKLIQARSQLAKWKEALDDAVISAKRNLQSTLDSAKLTLKSHEALLRDQENAALALNKQAIRYNVLTRDVESDKAMYQAVLTRIKETDVTKELLSTKVHVVETASLPERSVKPNKVAVATIGPLTGLGAGLLLVLLLTALDRSFKTVDDVEATLELPVLTAICKMKKVEPFVLNEGGSFEAEAFRTLRSCLSIRSGNEPSRVVLFTSAVPQEGKTFCSLNFAASLAKQGLRTLLIDCDLRRPMVEHWLSSAPAHGAGVIEILSAQANLDSVVRPTADAKLFYISSGTPRPNAAELLANGGVDSIIDAALEKFDRVVIDSAPIHAVSDTFLLLERVQAVCLVVHSNHTPRGSVRRAVEMLKEAGAPVVGIVLNLLPRARSVAYRYDNYYEYGYRGPYSKTPVST